MHTNDYLFPRRFTRRDFIRMTGAATAALALPDAVLAQESKEPVRIGSGKFTYTLDEAWGKLPEGMKYGFGCGIEVDGRDRIYVTSRSANPAVAVFDRDGKLLEAWGKDFADKVGYTEQQVVDSAHCIYRSKEKDGEFFYFTENAGKNGKDPSFGRRVYKTDLKGKVLYEIGNVAKEGSTAQKFEWTNPTDVAVAANGDIYIVDGYGSQRVSRFDKNFKHLKTIGGRSPKGATGPDAEHGTFNTCHGVWINTLKKGAEPEAYIADRHNDRVEIYDLGLNYKRTLKGGVRNPCCFYQHKDHLYIPDLGARVTILDADDKVVAQLGDGMEADGKTRRKDADKNPATFAAPHAMCVDSRGDLYVLEWVPFGRPRKFKHTPA
jgi:sugar lactone lactonase YvrE